ncbi:hypothetical protein [Lentimicrobium sp.]|uniref:hypothetical protein n=1 Tax=Lentimicrobium sp. TaxID=2034841 RepID=UPI002B8EE23B|nr:hypothetical protein [Lentimicrobium sp.]HPF65462.1 hypothetical protein [Lentimicrobium sp.]
MLFSAKPGSRLFTCLAGSMPVLSPAFKKACEFQVCEILMYIFLSVGLQNICKRLLYLILLYIFITLIIINIYSDKVNLCLGEDLAEISFCKNGAASDFRHIDALFPVRFADPSRIQYRDSIVFDDADGNIRQKYYRLWYSLGFWLAAESCLCHFRISTCLAAE